MLGFGVNNADFLSVVHATGTFEYDLGSGLETGKYFDDITLGEPGVNRNFFGNGIFTFLLFDDVDVLLSCCILRDHALRYQQGFGVRVVVDAVICKTRR